MAISPSGLVAGPINARAREIERVMKEIHMDPRLTRILVGMAERQNVEHQQMMQLAQLFDRMCDQLNAVTQKIGGLGTRLEKAGVIDKLKSLEAQDDSDDNTMQ